MRIFKFCQGCIGYWQRVKGHGNYCLLCLSRERRRNKLMKNIFWGIVLIVGIIGLVAILIA